jgi:hypothetical protein
LRLQGFNRIDERFFAELDGYVLFQRLANSLMDRHVVNHRASAMFPQSSQQTGNSTMIGIRLSYEQYVTEYYYSTGPTRFIPRIWVDRMNDGSLQKFC